MCSERPSTRSPFCCAACIICAAELGTMWLWKSVTIVMKYMLPFKQIDSLALTKYTAGRHLPVWRRPRNEPLVDVDRAILVAIHHQAAVLILTAIRPLPQWHVLLVLTGMAHPGCIAFTDYRECFPKAQTLVF